MAASGNGAAARLAVRIAAGPAAVARALGAADDFLRAASADDAMRARLAVIVEELVINVVEHGAPPAGDVIGLALRAAPDGVHLTLTDGGRPFDLRTRERDDDELPPERGGGAGIALVLAWSRITGYRRANERNRLELLIPFEG